MLLLCVIKFKRKFDLKPRRNLIICIEIVKFYPFLNSVSIKCTLNILPLSKSLTTSIFFNVKYSIHYSNKYFFYAEKNFFFSVYFLTACLIFSFLRLYICIVFKHIEIMPQPALTWKNPKILLNPNAQNKTSFKKISYTEK